MQNKTIKDFTDTELKAMAYDNLAVIENAQLNIKAINEELKARAEAKQPEVQEKPEK